MVVAFLPPGFTNFVALFGVMFGLCYTECDEFRPASAGYFVWRWL